MSNIVGYTTVNQKRTSLKLTDIELAKQDLNNHFHIRKGEKWTNPSFGSNLPYYVFQPLDSTVEENITEDVHDVVTNDPRFKLDDSEVFIVKDDHSITITVKLIYLPTTTATDLQIKFDLEFKENAEF
jgi:phage baseplate assembly protein W|tara:strand:+ start:209 stop:592 length:384 start_codon:yes stop_codon:yes gene_type:complete